MRPQVEALTLPPADPTAQGNAEEARLHPMLTLLNSRPRCLGARGEASGMGTGCGRGNRPALQSQRRSLLRNRQIMA